MTTDDEAARQRIRSRWTRLFEFLRTDPRDDVEVSIDQLDDLVDGGLPMAARRVVGEWWTNNPRHVYARSWLDAGRVADWTNLGDGGGFVRFAKGTRAVPEFAQLARANALRRRHFLKLALAAQSGMAPDEAHVRAGWTTAHTLYQVHFPTEGLYKVGIGKGDAARRLRDVTRGREAALVQMVATENAFIANVAECDVLDEVRPWYRYGDPRHPGGGATEYWDDSGPSVDLAGFLADVGGSPVRQATRI